MFLPALHCSPLTRMKMDDAFPLGKMKPEISQIRTLPSWTEPALPPPKSFLLSKCRWSFSTKTSDTQNKSNCQRLKASWQGDGTAGLDWFNIQPIFSVELSLRHTQGRTRPWVHSDTSASSLSLCTREDYCHPLTTVHMDASTSAKVLAAFLPAQTPTSWDCRFTTSLQQVLCNASINKYLLNLSLVFLYFLIERLVIVDTIYGGGHFWTPQTFVMSVRNLFNDKNCDVSKAFCHNCVWH